MSMLKVKNKLLKRITSIEGKKHQMSIGDGREFLSILIKLIADNEVFEGDNQDYFEVVEILFSLAEELNQKRPKKAKKK